MIRNYLVTALRNIRKHKGYSAINVLGLSLGLACCFFILLWVQDERSYDRFHEEGDQIYRVMRHARFGGQLGTTSSIPKPLDAVLDEEYPEITHSVLMSWEENMVITRGDQAFRADGRYFGSDFFTVFTFPLLIGDAATALQNPESIAINESMAEKYFGSDWRTQDDVLGTTFRIDNRLDVTLTGVFEDVPANSSIQFEFVLPIEEYIRRNDWVEHWGNNGLRMFVRLQKGADGTQVSEKIKGIIDEHVDQWETDLFLQPITDMYLRSDYEDGVLVGGRIDYVRVFLFVALFIILIASINFMNLATARSAQRAREIGVRKALGATKSLLARQFLGESTLTAMLAFVVAVAFVVILLPSFNSLTNKEVGAALLDPVLWLQFGALSLLTGILAGLYPAFYLSAFNVIGVLRRTQGRTARGAGRRGGPVCARYSWSVSS